MTALVLWTFTFFHPAEFAGRQIVDMTERDCHRLLADAARIAAGRLTLNVKVGECRPQTRS